MLLLIIKVIKEAHNEKQEKVITEYEKLIVNLSEKQISELIKFRKEIKLLKFHSSQDILSSNVNTKFNAQILQTINQPQNYIFYFQKYYLCQWNQNLDNDQFQNYYQKKIDDSQAYSRQLFDQKQIIVTFRFESKDEININFSNSPTETNYLDLLLNENFIVSQVTQKLLSEIGPNDNIQVIQQVNPDTRKVWNIVSIKIYSDQFLVEPSFLKYVNNKL